MTGLRVLAVDDERPSLDELSYLLEQSALVDEVEVAPSATEALRLLQREGFDAALVDIKMPGLDGLELARVLGRFAHPPGIVFVTAFDAHAVEAFDVGAAGYLLKPVDGARLDRVLRRIAARGAEEDSASGVVAVESGSRTVLVSRDDIVWIEASGDYVRLHLRDGASYLLRAPMAALEQGWSAHGFVRIHRGYLVSLRAVSELRAEEGHASVVVDGHVLPVSRRHIHDLRELLMRYGRPPARER